jgi:hypothetical protein
LDPGEPEKVAVVDRLYIETHALTVRDRLVKAGVRLGGLLNKALGDCGRQATQSASSSHRHDPAPCGVGMAAGR